MSLDVTLWHSLTDAHGTLLSTTWDDLAKRLAAPDPKPANVEHPKLRGWSPATFEQDRRLRAGTLMVTALGLDHDKGGITLERLREAYAGLSVLIHNTRRSSPSAPRWRVVVALSRPMRVEEHERVWISERNRLAALGLFIDEQTKDPSRFWFVPCEPIDGEFVFERLEGSPLNVDEVLSKSALSPELPSEPTTEVRTISLPAPSADESEELARIKLATRRRRAAAYLTRAEPAVSGEEGHKTAMRVVTAVVRGFALDPYAAREVLETWNARCDPPWSGPELDHKIREAMRVGAVQWGSKLLVEPESPDTEGNAARKRAPRKLWEAGLLRNPKGEAKKLLANVILVLSNADEWAGAVAWDEFAERIVILRECPAGSPGQWTDLADARAAMWLQQSKWRIEAGPDMVAAAIRVVSDNARFHPVRGFLESLKWDGAKRIDTWLVRYFGVEDSPYARAVGRRWLISAVARVFSPGCQADSMLILEGDQGLRKSTALRILAGDEWFLDTGIDVNDKSAAFSLLKKWVVELSELAALKGNEVERVKQFVSTRVDTYRHPYGRHFIDHPRQCVLVGTTNASKYLRDETGARRFWPVRVTGVDVDALKADREQLWAEAVAAYLAGERWYLDTEELRAAASEEQEARRTVDPWEEALSEWLDSPVRQSSGVRIADIYGDCLKLEISKRSRADEMRIGSVLSKLGWERRRVMIASSRSYMYFRRESGGDRPQDGSPDSSIESNGSPSSPIYPTHIHTHINNTTTTKGFNGNRGADGADEAGEAEAPFADWVHEQGLTHE